MTPLPMVVLRKYWQRVIYFKTHKPPTLQEWTPPQEGWIKLNFDGSSLGNPGPSGIGGLIRSHNGQIVTAYSGPLGSSTSNTAESEALLAGLKLALPIQTTIVIEGDSKLVIGWGSRTTDPPWRLKVIYDEIYKLVEGKQILWSKVPRSANSEADKLAKDGVHRQEFISGAIT